MNTFLSVSSKATDPTNFEFYLRKYIQRQYNEDPSAYASDLRNLDALRVSAVANETHAAHLDTVLRYFGQLEYIGAKFPIDEVTIVIPFCWYNAFAKDKRGVTCMNLAYEKASILFNIGAIYSRLAVKEPNDGEGIKRACLLFKNAAGAFKKLEEYVQSTLKNAPISDMSRSSLFGLIKLMLAQAQECFVLKSILDDMKDSSVYKLAEQAAEYYEAAYNNCGSADIFSREYMLHIQVKALYMHAIACYRKGNECNTTGKYGDQVAWLRKSSKKMDEALSKDNVKILSVSTVSELDKFRATVASALKSAEKDNDIVYLMAVPALDSLETLSKADMVSPAPLPDLAKAAGAPFFASLVPFHIHQIASIYEHQRDQLIQAELGKAKEATHVFWSSLGSLNLPESIDALDSPVKVPSNIYAQAKEVQTEGGMKKIAELQNEIAQLSQKSRGIIKTVNETLDKEQADDENMRTQFAHRWARKPSKDLQSAMRSQISLFESKLNAAAESDNLVNGKIDKNKAGIEKLELSNDLIERSLPAASVGIKDDAVVRELRALMKDVNEIVKRRNAIVEEFSRVKQNDNIGTVLMELTSKKQEFTNEALFEKELQKYEPLRNSLKSSLQAQEDIMVKITKTNGRFVQTKNNDETLRQREKTLQTLNESYRAFKEILANLTEGHKFYSDMHALLERVKDDAMDYTFARNVERKDYLNDLTSQLANMRVSESPSPPKPSRNDGSVTSQSPRTAQAPQPLPAPYNSTPPQPSQAPPAYPQQSLPSYMSPPPSYTAYAPPPGGFSGFAPPVQEGYPTVQPGLWNPHQPILYAGSSNPPPHNPMYVQQHPNTVPQPYAPETAMPDLGSFGQPIIPGSQNQGTGR